MQQMPTLAQGGGTNPASEDRKQVVVSGRASNLSPALAPCAVLNTWEIRDQMKILSLISQTHALS